MGFRGIWLRRVIESHRIVNIRRYQWTLKTEGPWQTRLEFSVFKSTILVVATPSKSRHPEEAGTLHVTNLPADEIGTDAEEAIKGSADSQVKPETATHKTRPAGTPVPKPLPTCSFSYTAASKYAGHCVATSNRRSPRWSVGRAVAPRVEGRLLESRP